MHVVGNFRHILNIKTTSKYQKIANDYWQSSDNSYLAPDELYINQEKALLELFVPRISKDDIILDVGCSNGRFAFLVSKYCKTIDAFDLSPSLINLAQALSHEEHISNINFNIADIRDLKTDKQYDHVMCMGVFTTIPDEKLVKNTMIKFSRIIRKGGYLVLKDTIASLDSQLYTDGKYAAVYRNENVYKSMFESVGMKLESKKVLNTVIMLNQEMSSKLFLLKNIG